MTRRLLLIPVLTLLVFALRAIPTDTVPPARASVCSVPLISTVCGAVSSVYHGITWTLDTATGAVKVGNDVIGKITTVGTTYACEKLSPNFTTGLCKWILKKIGTKIASGTSPPSSTTTAGPPPDSIAPSPATTDTASATPSDSPQSYLRTSSIAAGAAAAVGSVAHAISRGTTADQEAPWFQSLYGRAAEYAAAVALLALMCALAEGAARGDGELVMHALRAVPYAAVVTFAASALIALGIAIVDDAGQFITGSSLHDATTVLHVLAGLFVALGLAAKGAAASGHASIARLAAFPAAMFSIFGAIGAGVVLLELLLREVAIYAGTLFLPLVLAARVWPRLAHAATKLGHTLLAVILSKLVLVMTLGLAASAILHGGGTGVATGAGALLLAGLAPGVLYGVFALAEHRFHRGALPAGFSPTSAGERMAEIVGWHSERADRVRSEYYQTRPDLLSPVSASASGSGGSSDQPPPQPPSVSPSPRPEPQSNHQQEEDPDE
jgi:hypothetical protein